MKISYRTHPVCKILEGDYLELNCKESDRDEMLNHCESLRNHETIYLTRPFLDAAINSQNKLMRNDLIGEIPSTNIIIISPKKKAIFVSIKNNKNNKEITGKVATVSTVSKMYSNVFIGYGDEPPHSNLFRFDKAQTPKELFASFLIILFKKYAQVETKYLPANKTTKDINCKYVNETSSNITILDSKWFTTLVKSDAFKVRGHFRLQPKKKDGEWTKELIWINDFTKDGYTAPARILNNNQNNQQ